MNVILQFAPIVIFLIMLGVGMSVNIKNFIDVFKNLNKEVELSSDRKASLYLNNVRGNEPVRGVNAASIADISRIPRATVLRKLKILLSEKIIKRNKKLEYVLTNEGELNKKIQDNFLVNQRQIALFVTNIFNLIKKSPLKI